MKDKYIELIDDINNPTLDSLSSISLSSLHRMYDTIRNHGKEVDSLNKQIKDIKTVNSALKRKIKRLNRLDRMLHDACIEYIQDLD